jgi:hypothetical protein
MKTTIQEFKALLKKDYKEYMTNIPHEDDSMPMSEYHSNNADIYERQCGVIWDDHNEEWIYTFENENYTEEEDDDEFFY